MTYVTLEEVKYALGISDDSDDLQIQSALTAAEQLIDGYCERTFGPAGTAVTSRVYATMDDDLVYIDDATSITAIATDDDADGTYETTWSASDWQAEPLNGRSGGLTVPYSAVRAINVRDFPTGNRASVQVSGTFGWSDVPAAVSWAALQQALRFFKRKDSPLGTIGAPDIGYIRVTRGLDTDIAQALAPYRKGTASVGGIA